VGVGAGNSTKIEVSQGSSGQWTAAETVGITKYGCTITVPATFENSEFSIRADGGAAFSANVARPWFVFGDSGSFATPGGWARVVGEAINLGADTKTPSILRLEHVDGAGAPQEIQAVTEGGPAGSALTRWHAFFPLPASLVHGVYNVSIAAGKGATFSLLNTFIDPDTPSLATLNVSTPVAWKTEVFRVNATQPGVGRDATAAVQAALSAANTNGGGVVFFPFGQYFIRGPLIVNPGVVLRGESRELVSIYFHEDNQTTAPPAYVTSSKPGHWGVEDLTFYITSYANDIVRFIPGTDGAFFRRNRIRFNSYFCLEPITGKGSRGRNTAWPHSVGTAVKLAGTNLFITDNDIYSSGDVVSTLNNGAAGATYMHIARNRLWNGGTTHWGARRRTRSILDARSILATRMIQLVILLLMLCTQVYPGSSVSTRTMRRRGQVLRPWAATTRSTRITMAHHISRTYTTTTTPKIWSGRCQRGTCCDLRARMWHHNLGIASQLILLSLH
jgi:hypothetical protein